MTRTGRAVAGASTAAVAAALLTAHLPPPHRHRAAAAVSAPGGEAAAVAREFVTAVAAVDPAHPHGNLPALERLCGPRLLDQLTTTPTLTPAQRHARLVQRADVTAVATRAARAQVVVLVTVRLTVTGPAGPPLATAATYTVTVQRSGARWLVVGAST